MFSLYWGFATSETTRGGIGHPTTVAGLYKEGPVVAGEIACTPAIRRETSGISATELRCRQSASG
jgi:hypothetical protein